jgi:hypothetical protein
MALPESGRSVLFDLYFDCGQSQHQAPHSLVVAKHYERTSGAFDHCPHADT